MAAAPSSLGEQISEELACSICLELFTRPKVLPCQHTFCQDCLQDITGKNKHLKCPNCRQQVKLPPQGVAGLPDNHLVTSLCERLRNQATLSGETREQPQSGNRCSFHPSEEVKLYCKQCNMPVCNECLDEAHSAHRTISLKKASQERKAPVQALIADGRNILETYCGFLRRLREKEKSLDKKKQQTDNSIKQAYSEMVQKLTDNRDLLLSEVDKKHKKNKEVVQKERDRVLADVNEMSAACDRAEQELEAGGVQCLGVQETNLTEVVRKYRGKAAPTLVQILPTDFQPTDTPLPVLGQVTVPEMVSYAPRPMYKAEIMTFGGEGSGTGQFDYACDVTVSDEGEIFVADTGNQRIQVFTLQGTFVRQFPTVVPSSSLFSFLLYPFHQTFMYPYFMAMDGERNLWVVGNTDSADFAVQYNKQGRVLRKFDLQKTGGVAVDTRRNHILITQTTGDLFNPRGEVLVFRPDGTLVRTVGQQQGMKEPWSITVDGEGNILVLELGTEKDFVYMYNEYGQFLDRFEGEGSGYNESVNSHGRFCTDRAGNIFVAKCRCYHVNLFDKTLEFLEHINIDPGILEAHGVAMGPQGQLVMADCLLNTVHIIHSCQTEV